MQGLLKRELSQRFRQLLHPTRGQTWRCYSAEGSVDQVQLIRLLREKSSAPMKHVKAALVQSNWDVEAAFTELRKQGLAAVSKKASRIATEGLLALSERNGAAAIIELNSETDFVARNEIFQYLASQVANAALSITGAGSGGQSQATAIDLQALEAMKIKLEHPKLNCETTVQEAIKETAAIMGENVILRRGFQISTSCGVVSSYLHMGQRAGLGKSAGLLTLDVKEGTVQLPYEPLTRVGDSLAMHIVASRPLYLSKDLVTSDIWEHEKSIILSQMQDSKKSEDILNKMVEGRLRKFAEEVVFLEQKFVMNEKVTVQSVLENLAKEVGAPVKIGCYLRLEAGEGIQSEESAAPAEEVAQAA